MRKFYIIVLPLLVVLCLILAFSGLQNMFIIDNVEFLGILFSGTCLFALAYMYFKGTLKAKKISILFYLFLVLVIIGVLFRLQHWPGGVILTFAGCLGTMVSYVLHFIWKKIKYGLDWVKCFYVVTLMLGLIWDIFHYPYQVLFNLAVGFFFIVANLVFYIDECKGVDRRAIKKDAIADMGTHIFSYNDETNSILPKD